MTKKKAPGKSRREGISLVGLMKMFPDDETARVWFEKKIWPGGPYCPYCGSVNVQCGIKHKTMTHRCRDCHDRPMFSLKTGNVMESSKLGYQTWAVAIYLVTTSLKGVSSMKLHRDLDVTQKTAWRLAHRLRKGLEQSQAPFSGPVETDETFIGGRWKNMPKAKRRGLKGRGFVGKTAVVGMKDRATNLVVAHPVKATDKPTLQHFVGEHASPNAKVYSDDALAYRGLPFDHEAVNHSVGEYVRGQAHTNGIESFWSMLKRGYHGTFHHMSPKHLHRYVDEFTGRHRIREQDTLDQMNDVVEGMVKKRLRYRDLIA